MRATPTGSGLTSALGVGFFTTGLSSVVGVATITPGQAGLSVAGVSTGVMPDKGALGGVDMGRLREEVEESRSILCLGVVIMFRPHPLTIFNNYLNLITSRFIKWRHHMCHQRSPKYVSCIIIYNIPLFVYAVSVSWKQ